MQTRQLRSGLKWLVAVGPDREGDDEGERRGRGAGRALPVALDLGDQTEEFPGFGTGVRVEEFLRLIHRQHQRRSGRNGLVMGPHEPRTRCFLDLSENGSELTGPGAEPRLQVTGVASRQAQLLHDAGQRLR